MIDSIQSTRKEKDQMNQDIKDLAKEKNVKLWQVADKLGIADTTFCRKLRHELSHDEKERIKAIINEFQK